MAMYMYTDEKDDHELFMYM